MDSVSLTVLINMPVKGQGSHVQKEGTAPSTVNMTMHVNILSTHAQEEDSVTLCLMEPPLVLIIIQDL